MTKRSLGKALTILAQAEADEILTHVHISAWSAPSECHADACRGRDRRERQARKHAEAVYRRPYRIIKRDAKRNGMPIGSPRWERFIDSICCKDPVYRFGG